MLGIDWHLLMCTTHNVPAGKSVTHFPILMCSMFTKLTYPSVYKQCKKTPCKKESLERKIVPRKNTKEKRLQLEEFWPN